MKPVDLVAGLLSALTDRHPGLDPARVDDVVLGIVSATGEQGGVLPRAAVLAAGWPHNVPGVQPDRFCGSGLEAVNSASARVRAGFADLIVAGGVESMSRSPWAAPVARSCWTRRRRGPPTSCPRALPPTSWRP